MATQADYDALKRENVRLVSQARRLQELVQAMREEISDANAEIAASKRLYEEQRQMFLHELQRERAQKERLAQAIDSRNRIVKKSVATNTYSTVSTSTVSDAATNTVISTLGDKGPSNAGLVAATAASSSSIHRARPQTVMTSTGSGGSGMATQTPPGFGPRNHDGMGIPPPPGFGEHAATATPHQPPHHSAPYGMGPKTPHHYERLHENQELRQFADYLSRRSGHRGRDLYHLFDAVMGATNVTELCATINERDLVEYGIPLSKARSIMHLVVEHTAVLLSSAGEAGYDY